MLWVELWYRRRSKKGKGRWADFLAASMVSRIATLSMEKPRWKNIVIALGGISGSVLVLLDRDECEGTKPVGMKILASKASFETPLIESESLRDYIRIGDMVWQARLGKSICKV